MISTDILLGLIAIVISIFTIFIARTHYIQLKKLEYIGNQTKETTNKLKTDSVIREIIDDVFILKDDAKIKQKKFKCFFPTEHKSKPLPLINQGDFYAIHVLSSRIGEDNLELKGITKNESFDMSLSKGNVIFICSPTANPALKSLYDIKVIETEEDMKSSKEWLMDELRLPCWFVEDFQEGRSIRKIMVYDGIFNDLVDSPAEECYIEASRLDEGKKYNPKTNLQRDCGIFARINENNNMYFIIAGIHQYGTWIVARLLSNLLSNDDVDYKSTFRGSKDFIGIITGEFDHEKLTINAKSIAVHNQYMWVKEEGKWIRKYRSYPEKKGN